MSIPADPYLWFEVLRWGSATPDCPHCGADASGRFLAPGDTAVRRTRTGAETGRRVWRCAVCRRQFSVLTGTVFEGTRVPLTVVAGVVAAVAAKEPLVAADVATRFGLSAETARALAPRATAAVRAATAAGGRLHDPLGAVLRLPPVEVDRIRASAGPRVRERGRVGPSADYR